MTAQLSNFKLRDVILGWEVKFLFSRNLYQQVEICVSEIILDEDGNNNSFKFNSYLFPADQFNSYLFFC
jgi:hypothetical protein